MQGRENAHAPLKINMANGRGHRVVSNFMQPTIKTSFFLQIKIENRNDKRRNLVSQSAHLSGLAYSAFCVLVFLNELHSGSNEELATAADHASTHAIPLGTAPYTNIAADSSNTTNVSMDVVESEELPHTPILIQEGNQFYSNLWADSYHPRSFDV
jgi:hypothetical protein